MQLTAYVLTFEARDYQARNGMPASHVDALICMDMSEPAADRMTSAVRYMLQPGEAAAHDGGKSLVGKTVTIAFRDIGQSKAGVPIFRGRIVSAK